MQDQLKHARRHVSRSSIRWHLSSRMRTDQLMQCIQIVSSSARGYDIMSLRMYTAFNMLDCRANAGPYAKSLKNMFKISNNAVSSLCFVNSVMLCSVSNPGRSASGYE